MKMIIGKNKTEISINKSDYEKVIRDGFYFCNCDRGYIVLKRKTGVNGRTKKGDILYKYEQFYLHRYITQCPKGKYVDHIDGNRLNNVRTNLRICTNAENIRNRKAVKGKYKGVHFSKKLNKWVAQITTNYKCKHLGCFGSEKEAALAYNEAAIELHGEFAYLNKI